MFGAGVVFDDILAGVRNVLMRIGTGHINFYDQPPRDFGRNAVDHLGIYTDDISALVVHLEAKGFKFQTPIRVFEDLKYIMLEGPGRVPIELSKMRQLSTVFQAQKLSITSER